MQTYRSSILPLVAFVITIFSISYSACHESKAELKSTSSASVLVSEISNFQMELADIKVIHDRHIKTYCDAMGCTKDSKALEIINHDNELIDRNVKRLQFHQMQLVQADTANKARNEVQLAEVKKDYEQLIKDGQEIRTGFDNFIPTHVTR